MDEMTWMPYSERRPDGAGVYAWRVPSTVCAGLVVEFLAHMRTTNNGVGTVISPAFDFWTGSRLVVPAGTLWQPVQNPPRIKPYDFARVTPVDVELLPCPFCGTIPTWHANHAGRAGGGDGVVVCGRPHNFNCWHLECCSWAGTVRFDDPRTLANDRNRRIREFLSRHA